MLVLRNKVVEESLYNILQVVKSNCNGKITTIINDKENIKICCPYHCEKHPSAYIYCGNNKNIKYGTFHCFVCNTKVSFVTFVANMLEISNKEAVDWLLNNFVTNDYSIMEHTEEIDLSKHEEHYLDESILNQYEYYHDYMFQRGLTKEIIDKFHIGFNPNTNALTFPVWNENDKLVMITERCVDTKRFHIPKGIEKPIYLLNYIEKENIQTVVVTESQLNALTSWKYGYPAIALFGTGSQHSYDILNKSGIRHYILMLDGDNAGRKGVERFKKNIRDDVFITDIVMPIDKDVNDLSKEEFLEIIKKFS